MGDAQAGAGIMYEVIMPDVVKPNSFWEHGHWDNEDQCLKKEIYFSFLMKYMHIYADVKFDNQPHNA